MVNDLFIFVGGCPLLLSNIYMRTLYKLGNFEANFGDNCSNPIMNLEKLCNHEFTCSKVRKIEDMGVNCP